MIILVSQPRGNGTCRSVEIEEGAATLLFNLQHPHERKAFASIFLRAAEELLDGLESPKDQT